LLGLLLVLKVVLNVVLTYPDYCPPNFQNDFLLGRDAYFWQSYHLGFYSHIVSGPLSLLLGIALISEKVRTRFPHWHRRMGRIQIANILLIVVPSGLWMSFWAASGPAAGWAFATLGLVTLFCTIMGWRQAVRRQFASHRRWMWRVFVLLCSAVTIRALGGFAITFGWHADWIYPVNGWLSWTLPLIICECCLRFVSPEKRN
jgi:hypothetical protein